MTKEYTGPEFRPIFNAAMAAWYTGNCEGVCPMGNWQSKPVKQNIWFVTESSEPPCESGIVYRFKPAPKRVVAIGYGNVDGGAGINHGSSWKTLVAPETVAPPIGTPYFYLEGVHRPTESCWDDHNVDRHRLSKNVVFLTREDAQAMSDWQAKCRGGGA